MILITQYDSSAIQICLMIFLYIEAACEIGLCQEAPDTKGRGALCLDGSHVPFQVWVVPGSNTALSMMVVASLSTFGSAAWNFYSTTGWLYS